MSLYQIFLCGNFLYLISSAYTWHPCWSICDPSQLQVQLFSNLSDQPMLCCKRSLLPWWCIQCTFYLTRPKPAYGRQGLEWDRRVRNQLRRLHFGVDTFGRIFIFGKQYPWSGFPWLIKCHLHETTLKNHGNQPKTVRNNETTLKSHGNQPKTMKLPWKTMITKNHDLKVP